MTQVSNTYDSYDVVGDKEDVSDIINNITPYETPFYTRCKKGECYNTLHQWQVQSLAIAAQNAAVEGDEITANSVTATTMYNNYTQISDKGVVVSNSAISMKYYGREKELSYQLTIKGRELKRDLEKILIGINKAKAVGASDTARYTGSVLTWVTNESKASNGSAPTGDGSDTRTDGTQRDFNESYLQSVIQDVWSDGGNPEIIMSGPFNKGVISSFSGNSTRMVDASKKQLFASIDVYTSNFGTLKVIPNRLQRARDVWVLDMEYWKVCFLRPMTLVEVPKAIDGEFRQLITEYALEASAPNASGIVADLTTS